LTYDEAAVVLGCFEQHTQKRYGRWQRGTREEFGILLNAGGRISYRMRCLACDHMSSDLPANQWKVWGIQRIEFTDIRPAGTYDPCVVMGCTQPGREEHHFAPRNTFLDDADSWPILPLCPEHHREWHRRMDGYRWHRRAEAA